MEPESNHASSTGSTRYAVPLLHAGQEIVTSSTNGRCRSIPPRSRADNSDSSLTEPTHTSWLQSWQRQTGIGVPQYRSRDNAQSTLFSSQSPKRPCLMWSGYQLIVSFSRNSASLRSDVRANHVGFAQ
jgi:hypothetical protein